MIKFRPDPKPDYHGQKLAKEKDRNDRKKEERKSHDRFFRLVWLQQPHKCYNCGTPVTKYSNRNIHHIIEKHMQDRYTCDLDNSTNGIIVCWPCHDQTHRNIAKVPKIQALTFIRQKEAEKFRIK